MNNDIIATNNLSPFHQLCELKGEMEKMVRLKADECRILSSHLDVAQERLAVLEKEKSAESARVRSTWMLIG